MPMKINIKRIDKTLPLPKYETEGSVGFDLICRESAEIPPHSIVLIPANVIVETPRGYMLMVCLRSSTPRKLGLMMPQGVGIVDNDYCGEEDELKIQVYNFTNTVVNVERGSRIAQAIFVRVDTAAWNEVEQMHSPSRGGFGSTD
jgi:dUTP pyrophosphatase